ncbi:MAG TPA: hypothetical protein VFK06_06785 [Candidatus Angelobacter sp.]|nr:hypothetical protein [Candidatus Angelobacter sp.]
MLANETIASRRQQAKVLKCIVRGALAGEDITEKYIRETVFPTPPYKPESNIARRTIDLVRTLLMEYYARDGQDDVVIIRLPQSPPGKRIKFQAGEAYKPLFSYNPSHPDSQKFRLGTHFLQQKSPEAMSAALDYLHDVTSSQAGHTGAHIGLVEALCAMSVYMSRSSPETEMLSVALQIAKDAVELTPDDWHTHAARGAALLCCHEIVLAGSEFKAALQLDKAQTLNYAWYQAFLFTTDKRERALLLAKLNAEECIESPDAQCAYGLYLYAVRQFGEAEAVLANALKLDRNRWFTHLALCVLYLALDRADEALHHYERLQLLVGNEKGQWVMPGLAALCVSRAKKITSQKRGQTIAWVKELIANIDESVDWVQCAIACMAFGENQRAVWALEHAFNKRHPLILWLDAWPIFDPIRKQKGFQKIICHLNRSTIK